MRSEEDIRDAEDAFDAATPREGYGRPLAFGDAKIRVHVVCGSLVSSGVGVTEVRG